MRDFLQEPACGEDDLGIPLPDDPHAVSVALPLWKHVIGYEESDPDVIQELQTGYPRFFLHAALVRLFGEAERDCARFGERALVFPTEAAASRCRDYVIGEGSRARIQTWRSGTWAVVLPQEAQKDGLRYWRFSGEIISSRRAEAILEERDAPVEAQEARAILRQRLADLSGQRPEDVYLFPSGISATFASARLAWKLREGKTIQLEFPYVDVLKVQEQFGNGVEFLPDVESGGVEQVREVVENQPICGVFAEVPSNPLLRTPDLPGMAALLGPLGIPLMVDDTVGSSVNLQVFPHADVVTTSLTKFFSGVGDVLAGALILRSDSPLHDALSAILQEHETEDLWGEDVIVLERNSRDFPERMAQINRNAEAVHSFLRQHPAVEKVWYPKSTHRSAYEACLREGGGYGGLISFLLKDAAVQSPIVHDAMRVSKGPSLGTNFSLLCPYMLLAHYEELDWAEELGISRYLLRLSVGLEPAEDLTERLDQALSLSSEVT